MNTIIKHVQGNHTRLAIPLTKRVCTLIDGAETMIEEDFIPNASYPVYVALSSPVCSYEMKAKMESNVAIVNIADTVKSATYNVTVKCRDEEGRAMRYMARAVLKVVEATADAGIGTGVEFDVCSQALEGTVFFYAKGDKGDKGDEYIITEEDYQAIANMATKDFNGRLTVLENSKKVLSQSEYDKLVADDQIEEDVLYYVYEDEVNTEKGDDTDKQT